MIKVHWQGSFDFFSFQALLGSLKVEPVTKAARQILEANPTLGSALGPRDLRSSTLRQASARVLPRGDFQ